MSETAFAGAVELGLIFGFVAIGVYLSFRVLDFPDLTVDGSFPLGACVCAAMVSAGVDPWMATLAALAAGLCAGAVTAALSIKLRILGLLAGILTMTALYSVNLRIMGKPNLALLNEPTVFLVAERLGVHYPWVTVCVAGVLVLASTAATRWLLGTQWGLALRATGVNARMARAQGVDTASVTFVGLALSNGLVAVGGALFAQANGFADVTSGIGTIVVGLASVILGETLFRGRSLGWLLLGVVAGSVVYRIAVQAALSADGAGLQPSDLSLVTAVLVTAAMVVPRIGSLTTRRSAA